MLFYTKRSYPVLNIKTRQRTYELIFGFWLPKRKFGDEQYREDASILGGSFGVLLLFTMSRLRLPQLPLGEQSSKENIRKDDEIRATQMRAEAEVPRVRDFTV